VDAIHRAPANRDRGRLRSVASHIFELHFVAGR
jgi:hypothetical protein